MSFGSVTAGAPPRVRVLRPEVHHSRVRPAPDPQATPQQVQRFLNETHGHGLAPRTVQYIRAILRRARNQALRWELVARNVATLADPPTGRSPEMRPLTTADARQFLAAARGHRHE